MGWNLATTVIRALQPLLLCPASRPSLSSSSSPALSAVAPTMVVPLPTSTEIPHTAAGDPPSSHSLPLPILGMPPQTPTPGKCILPNTSHSVRDKAIAAPLLLQPRVEWGDALEYWCSQHQYLPSSPRQPLKGKVKSAPRVFNRGSYFRRV